LIEDKAVDLFVLERAFLSTHPNLCPLFDEVLQVYFRKSSHGEETKARLDEGKYQKDYFPFFPPFPLLTPFFQFIVRLRGRKRDMIG
jgi:hypothetical protein